jgi:hypothetical protein
MEEELLFICMSFGFAYIFRNPTYFQDSYCHMYGGLKMGFRLVIGFISNLQVITTINYYTIAALHNLQSLHTDLFGLSALVFMDSKHRNYNSLTELHTPDITHK